MLSANLVRYFTRERGIFIRLASSSTVRGGVLMIAGVRMIFLPLLYTFRRLGEGGSFGIATGGLMWRGQGP